MLDKFPFREETIKDLIVLDPRNRLKATAQSVLRLMEHFVQTSTEDDRDQIQQELRYFKSMPESQLPEFNHTRLSGLDHFWANLGDMTQPGNSEEKRFAQLSNLCKVLLVLPHSTADAERLFSIIKKIETDQHSSLSPTTIQMNTNYTCFQSSQLFSLELLSAAQTATRRSLQDHSTNSE